MRKSVTAAAISAVAMVATALTGPAASATPEPEYDQVIGWADFSGHPPLVLNGAAVIAAGETKRKVLRLTSGQRDQAGAAWWADRVDLRKSFKSTFDVQMTGPVAHGDGIAFVVQADGAKAIGGSGGSIGYGGMTRSVAVEFDTYRNPNDMDNNSVSIVTGGASGERQDSVTVPTPLFGQVLRVRVDYHAPTETMNVRVRSVTGPSLAIGVLTQVADLREALGSRKAYLGFTGATGADVATQDILNWSLKVAR